MAALVKYRVNPDPEPSEMVAAKVATLLGPAGTPAKAIGPVQIADRLKAAYHTFVLLAGGLLIFLQEMTPATQSLPEMDRHYISLVILGLTAFLTAARPAPPADEAWLPPGRHAK